MEFFTLMYWSKSGRVLICMQEVACVHCKLYTVYIMFKEKVEEIPKNVVLILNSFTYCSWQLVAGNVKHLYTRLAYHSAGELGSTSMQV